MKELLNEELAKPVEVTISGTKYNLAFPIGAVILYKKMTGDSLFNLRSWAKKISDEGSEEGAVEILIGPKDDPEKFLYALYAGIYGGQLVSGHRGEPDPLILSGLKATVDISNTGDVFLCLVKALADYVIPKAVPESDDRPQMAGKVN